MAITFGDFRRDAGDFDPPEQEREREDDELGMVWWNRLSKVEREKWSEAAGNTGRAKDAWEAFKRGSEYEGR